NANATLANRGLNYSLHQLQVQQGASSAIYNWQSFNIATGNTVEFAQRDASWVALNRIFDARATTIDGTLKGVGQIYLINPNGILFGSGAVVDVGALIASTLNISDERITRGLLFLNNLAAPVFQADPNLPADPANPDAGSIRVAQGARLYAAGRDQSGTLVRAGRIFLL